MDSKQQIFTEGSIGGMVLEALTLGLYSDNLNCLREYIQNAIDAKATRVDIGIVNGGKRISITDDGEGMNETGLLSALRLGSSSKTGEDVGWRGIGIWSGVGLCDRLEIATKRSGFSASKISIDCKSIRDRGNLRKSSLVDLMNSITSDMVTEGDPDSSHYSKITLSGIPVSISKEYVDQKKVLEFVERTVPLKFKDAFGPGKAISDKLSEYKIKEHSCRVFVCGEEAFKLPHDSVDLIETPHFEEFHSDASDLLAVGWFVSTNKNEALEYGSLTFRKKGFRIGETPLVTAMAAKPFRPWYHGEIHILSSKIVENASRDGINRDVPEAEQLLRRAGEVSDNLEQLSHSVSDNLASKYLDKGKDLMSKGKVIDAEAEFEKVEERKGKKPSPTMIAAFPTIVKEILRLKDMEQKELESLKGARKPRPAERPHTQPPTRKRKTLIPGKCTLNIGSTRANNFYDELRSIDVKRYTNSVSVAFRVFLELSADEYIDRYGLQFDQKNDNLGNKLRTIIQDILEKGKLSDDEKKMLKHEKNHLKGDFFNSLNGFVHNKDIHPGADELKGMWDQIEASVRIMWEICSGDRLRT